MNEYRTVNADLAASLATYGIHLLACETKDGITVEFVFEPTIGSRATSDVAGDWQVNALQVDAQTLTRNVKKIYRRVRQTQRDYAHERGTSTRSMTENMETQK